MMNLSTLTNPSSKLLHILLYVDDSSIFCESIELLEILKSQLKSRCLMKDLGITRSFLGIEYLTIQNQVVFQ